MDAATCKALDFALRQLYEGIVKDVIHAQRFEALETDIQTQVKALVATRVKETITELGHEKASNCALGVYIAGLSHSISLALCARPF